MLLDQALAMQLEELLRDHVGGARGQANVLHQQREEDLALVLGRLGPGALEGRAVRREVVLEPGLGADAARAAGGEETARSAGGVRLALPRPALARDRAHGSGGVHSRPRSPGAPSTLRQGGASPRAGARAGRPGRAHVEQATVRVRVARRDRHGLVGLARQRVTGRTVVDGAQLELGARRRRGRVG